jgi:hypothetical protein
MTQEDWYLSTIEVLPNDVQTNARDSDRSKDDCERRNSLVPSSDITNENENEYFIKRTSGERKGEQKNNHEDASR